MSYNTQKAKWTFNVLIYYFMQEEERVKWEKIESATLAIIPRNKKSKRERKF